MGGEHATVVRKSALCNTGRLKDTPHCMGLVCNNLQHSNRFG